MGEFTVEKLTAISKKLEACILCVQACDLLIGSDALWEIGICETIFLPSYTRESVKNDRSFSLYNSQQIETQIQYFPILHYTNWSTVIFLAAETSLTYNYDTKNSSIL